VSEDCRTIICETFKNDCPAAAIDEDEGICGSAIVAADAVNEHSDTLIDCSFDGDDDKFIRSVIELINGVRK
jgi:hypothetical protein